MSTVMISRREFLKASGSLVVTFTVPALVTAAHAQQGVVPKTVAPTEVDGFLAVNADGTITVFSGKVDLGTGVKTALAQMAAEELDTPIEKIIIIQGDTLLTPDQGPTYGSLSIQNGGMQIRQAAATARGALLDEAAKRLNVPREELATRDGAVVAKSGKRVAYSELVGGRNFQLKVDAKAKPKDPAAYTVVGKSVPRLDIPGKVSGEFTYMQDFRAPDMVHARVIRPAGMKSDLQSFDDAAARNIPGYIRTVREGNFLAVVAENEWDAIRAARAVKASWSKWEGLPDKKKLFEYVRASKVNKDEELQKVGDSAAALAGAGVKPIKATYDFAIHTHGSIGPSAAVAQWKDGQLVVWTASQQTHLLRKQLATMFRTGEENVRCLYIEGSGCYGRNGHEDAAADAALVAKAIGRPVRVQWMREDEHGWDPKGPPTLLDYRGAIDAKGNVVAWESEAFLPDRPKTIAVTLVAAELSGMPKDEAHPGNIHQGMAIPYNFANIKSVAHWVADTPFRPSWIRTPGRMQNTFGNECFLDELAHSAGIDPLELRLRNLKADDKRGIECLERLARLANWKPRAAKDRAGGEVATGRGVSYIKYELVRTYVGVACDVEVNRRTGKIVVKRFYVAHDCGQIINPDGLRNQIDGNVIQTVSRTLIEDLQFDRSKVTSLDWASYPILTFPDVPEVVMDLIDRPNERPWGAGEPTAAVVPSAISNAVYDAVGVRLRSVPFTPDKVKAALAAA
jgi:CO/xanthine dehydrogenase Mo-binding subunit